MTPIRFKVKEIREAAGLSQSDLARDAGVSRSTVHRLETQAPTSIDIDVLERIADALYVDATQLLAHDRNAKRGGRS